MSPLWKKKDKVPIVNFIIKKPSLTQNGRISLIGPAQGISGKCNIKGIPLPSSPPGSMTLEAALVIPLFLFFFLNLMSSVEMLRLHGNVAAALWGDGRIMAVTGYAYDGEADENKLLELGGTLLSDAAVSAALVKQLGAEYLDESPLTYGRYGLNLLESSYMEEDCIDIKVTYSLSPIFDVPGFQSFRMANRYYARAWTGYEVWKEETATDQYVYVTTYSEVYHIREDCSYLARRIEQVSLAEAKIRRNSQGERYQSCLQCSLQMDGHGNGGVYITPDGERYHYTSECPALKRTIRTITYEEAVKKYRPCSKCAS